MEKRDKAEEFLKSLKHIEPLEDVPKDVSLRYQETLANLIVQGSQLNPKKNWITSQNHFAIAASFILVFALGAFFTLNPGGSSDDVIGINQNQAGQSTSEIKIKEDQLLYSADEVSTPESSNTPIKISKSGHDYMSIPSGFPMTISVGNTWNTTSSLDLEIRKCLKFLDLDKSTNLIDEGFLGKQMIQAIWTPLNSNSWNVYLLDALCNVLDKKFVQD